MRQILWFGCLFSELEESTLAKLLGCGPTVAGGRSGSYQNTRVPARHRLFLHGDGLDLLVNRRAAHWANIEFRGTFDAAAVVPAWDQRAVDGRIKAHLEKGKHQA